MAAAITGGLFVPIVSPFNRDGSLDVGGFRAIVEHMVGAGMDGLLVAGSNGEAFTLSLTEREKLYSAAVRTAGGRAVVMAGTGAMTFREAEQNTQAAADCGCDAAAILTPWFAAVTPRTLERYYGQLADSPNIPGSLPLLFYHNPWRTFVDWPARHIGELATRLAGRFIGVKDSANVPQRVAEVRKHAPEGFVVFAGQPHLCEAYGADGAIDMVLNLVPREARRAWEGDAEVAEFYRRVGEALKGSQNVIASIKAVMSGLGLPAGFARAPWDEIDQGGVDKVKAVLAESGRMAAGAADAVGGAPREVTGPIVHLVEPNLVEAARAGTPLPARRVAIYAPGEDDYLYNHHACITHFSGRYFAAFSSGPMNEDSPGQMIRVATSDDGLAWSDPAIVTPATVRYASGPGVPRWSCGGFWQRGDELYLLATLYSSARYVDGERTPGVCWEDLRTEALRWDGSAWQPAGLMLDDAYSNEAPRPLGDGRYLWMVEDAFHNAIAAVGGAEGFDRWQRVVLADRKDGWRLTEPSWFRGGDGRIRVLLRDDGGSRRLWLCESRDEGASFDTPRATDLTDAQSKFHALPLGDGRVGLLSNPAGDDTKRKLLTLAVSGDGEVFDAMHTVRYDEQAASRLAGMHKAAGFQYPHGMVHDGRLWAIYSVNKENIELSVIPLEDCVKERIAD